MKLTDVRTTMVCVPFARFGEFKPVTMWYATRYASLHCVTTNYMSLENTGMVRVWGERTHTSGSS